MHMVIYMYIINEWIFKTNRNRNKINLQMYYLNEQCDIRDSTLVEDKICVLKVFLKILSFLYVTWKNLGFLYIWNILDFLYAIWKIWGFLYIIEKSWWMDLDKRPGINLTTYYLFLECWKCLRLTMSANF